MFDQNQAREDLPLLWVTPQAWAEQVLREPLALLNDHAHLEKKAARNALDLLDRWPEPNPPAHWVQTMTAIAKDESDHLVLVTRLLRKRGGHMTKHHKNPYAAALRGLVRLGEGPLDLIDRLMVSALIEVRSCERFELLSRCCEDEELSNLYSGLWASEFGHYRLFLEAARLVQPAKAVDQRWSEMLEAEARIITAQPAGPTMHSGVSAK